jgi:hypothetical protein
MKITSNSSVDTLVLLSCLSLRCIVTDFELYDTHQSVKTKQEVKELKEWTADELPHPCRSPCHAVLLRVYIVSFPFDLHNAAVFDSHMPCRAHAIPLSCRSTKGLDCVFPIWFTQCGRVWFTHAMPWPCCSESNFPKPWHSATWAWHGVCELPSAVHRQHVGDLPVFSFFWIPHRVPQRLLSEAHQSVKL